MQSFKPKHPTTHESRIVNPALVMVRTTEGASSGP